MSPATVSVVICTRNRASALAAALDAWIPLLTDPGWNMVVVDDGSTDDTRRIIESRRSSFGDRLSIVATEGVGLGAARNRGWRAADGELILFTDDDCYPAPDLLATLRRVVGAGGLDFVGGRLVPHTPEDAGIAVVTRTQRVEVVGPSFIAAGLIPGANLSVTRAALERVGGFDPEFGAGTPFAAEDVELIARLSASGAKGAFEPALVVRHHHERRTDAERTALDHGYDRGRGAYFAKCLGNRVLRGIYLRGWISRAWRGSWARTLREWRGAWAYWTRPRAPTR